MNSGNRNDLRLKLLSGWASDTFLSERVRVCRGICMQPGNARCAYPVFTPVDEWCLLQEEELRALRGAWVGDSDRGRCIGIFWIAPVALSRCVDFLEWYFHGTGKSLPACTQWVADHHLLEGIYTVRGGEETAFVGLASGMANMSTVTIDRTVDFPVGLHFDNFDRLPLLERWMGRSRICINVGAQSRYFLFVNQQASGILQAVLSSPDVDRNLANRLTTDHRELVFQFFTRFPETSVYRVELRPGEGYMAPTENIIHDGSTLGTSAADWSMVWFGRFRWPGLLEAEL